MTQSGQGDEQQPPAVRPPDGGQPWGPGPDAGRPPSYQPGQPPQPPYDGGPAYGQAPQQPAPYGQGGQPAYGQQPPAYGQGQPLPPAQPQPYAQPLPPEAGPAAAPGGDADATQFIAPISGGLPPESPAESTQFLGRAPQYPQSPQPGFPPGGPDAEATQYIPPVPGGGAPYGERQPPAEFDNLFRSDVPEGATQQMPRIDPAPQAPRQPGHPQQQGHPQQGFRQQPPPPPYNGPAHDDEDRGGRRRKSGAVPLIAAVVVGCAVIGLGAGALMSGGDEDDKAKEPVASASTPGASEPAKEKEQPPADPAKPQAEALDKLLAVSNNSRAAVVGAVEKTKTCTDLDKAVSDLKGAAKQRRDLVTRLQGLSLDKLPNHERLSASLTKAWQASASADDHYAAWAAQAKSKKVCKHGHARATSHTRAATAKSGEASAAKRQASAQWNKIAEKYGLTKHQATEL
ncbi:MULTISPECIES: hypothetical protein [unclassified Streptomyces]|uniref:hypothetical protein n=1 Tax=unclassified Streptomyces TaxID=2593676 RepID=UPI000DAD47A0|nr:MULTISPECIES: hypothetical protein [unclassified Streptomyces]PZT75858.1 hypothetical protein DNK56_20835 [Streptomyces sp. AC1-42W]PZT80190.1 hypothetical protein DNK55_11850 [Streptomyces sp. AC1-42T]